MDSENTIRLIGEFGELADALREFRDDSRWLFRGHSNSEWSLIPKAGRLQVVKRNEEHYFEAWKRRAQEYVNPPPNDDWDWMSIAQHHGFPSRLLDWSINPLVAAFFACKGSPEMSGSIYAFSPARRIIRENIQPLDYTGVASFYPTAVTPRISRQSGIFTVHGPPDAEIKNGKKQGKLREFVIPKENKPEIVRDLDYFGVNDSSIFPDLEGLSKYLDWKFSVAELRAQIIEEGIKAEEPSDPSKDDDYPF